MHTFGYKQDLLLERVDLFQYNITPQQWANILQKPSAYSIR